MPQENTLVLHTRPIEPLLSNEQLLNGRVQFNYFVDPQYKHELYTGIIKEVKTHKLYGVQVYIQPDANEFNLAPRWCAMHQVRGWAWYDVPAVEEASAVTQKATAA